MKAVRCNLATFRKLLRVRHGLEDLVLDNVTMSDTLDVAIWRGEQALKALEESDPEEFERIMTTKFKFVDKADVAAEPVLIDADDDEDDDDEEEMVEKAKPKTTRAAAKKKKTR